MPAQFSIADAAVWVDEFGSTRLQKAKALGLLSASKGVYRAERLAKERPGWEFLGDECWTTRERNERIKPILNPTEEALDALGHALAQGELEKGVRLSLAWFITDENRREEWLTATSFLGRLIGISVWRYNQVCAEAGVSSSSWSVANS